MVAARYTTSKPRRCEQIRSEASKSLTKNRCGAAATEPGHAGRREHPTNTLVDVRAGRRRDPMAVSDRVGLLAICAIPWLRSLRALQCDSHPVAIGRRALGLWRNFSHPRVEHALPGFMQIFDGPLRQLWLRSKVRYRRRTRARYCERPRGRDVPRAVMLLRRAEPREPVTAIAIVRLRTECGLSLGQLLLLRSANPDIRALRPRPFDISFIAFAVDATGHLRRTVLPRAGKSKAATARAISSRSRPIHGVTWKIRPQARTAWAAMVLQTLYARRFACASARRRCPRPPLSRPHECRRQEQDGSPSPGAQPEGPQDCHPRRERITNRFVPFLETS